MEMTDNSGVNKLRTMARITSELRLERGFLMTESCKNTEAFPHVIRRAKALKKILDETLFLRKRVSSRTRA
jgi:hypothetical protein